MGLAKLQELKGHVAIVAGGSRGLGLQMAEVLSDLDAKVAITARRREELDMAAAHLKSLEAQATAVVSGMGKLVTIPPMVEQVIGAFGPIDNFVNNAGSLVERSDDRATHRRLPDQDDGAVRQGSDRAGGPDAARRPRRSERVTALFASDACSFIPGQTLAVDSGLTVL